MIEQSQSMACVIRQYGTGLFRSCVSLDGRTSLCLHSTPDERLAGEIISRFLEARERGEIRTSEDVAAFRDGIRGAPVEAMAA